ncbi:hypothetical protein HS088_TW08G00438 [Tripterygium wilfordii]|uniref:Multifunctional fusion protein n=1 Tax=Tripterygium wilfordii TaxID=458696 RepID=A0A7J7DBX3_TRIWF|nr:hypothetical protein HS088_TW08G00438 [Tripterygium wilfordii]
MTTINGLSLLHSMPSLVPSFPRTYPIQRPFKLRCSGGEDSAFTSTISPSMVGGESISGGTHSSTEDCVIVGGGISGLCIAQALTNKHRDVAHNVIVTEARDRVGGSITTVEKDGYLWEEGPNSFQPSDVMLSLADDLVLGDPNAPRFVLWDGKLRPIPSKPTDLPFSDLMSTGGKLRAGLGDLGIRPPPPTVAADALVKFCYPPVAVVSISYPKEAIRTECLIDCELKGFGQVHPLSQGVETLGTIYSSSLFQNRAPAGRILLLNFIGGATNPGILSKTESELVEAVDRDLRRMLINPNAKDPLALGVRVWPQAIPQFLVGHFDILDAAKFALKDCGLQGLFLGGNCASGVALGRCVEGAYEIAAEMVLGHNKRIPTKGEEKEGFGLLLLREQELEDCPDMGKMGVVEEENDDECSSATFFVKVYMEGIPIGRKLDLLAHDCYQDLIRTLDLMFNTTIIWAEVDCGYNLEQCHVLTYEDKEGDWLMVGDVPWEMFLSAVRRLKITRVEI